MKIKLLCSAVFLHSVMLIGSQDPINLKAQTVARASVSKLKDLKTSHESAKQTPGMRLSQALFTACAVSVLVGAANANETAEPIGLERYPIYDVSSPDCIPVDFYPNMLCMRTEDFERNMNETLNSLAAIDDFYKNFMNGFMNHVYTEEEYQYYENLIYNYQNEGFVSQGGSQFKSLALARYPALYSSIATAYMDNNCEYYQWRQTRNQTNPYVPKFINGTLAYKRRPKQQQWKTLTWWTHGVYQPNPKKEEKALQLRQRKKEDMQKKLDNAKKRLQRSNQAAAGSKRQPKFNGSKKGR